ncbi:MAG: glycosyl transferase [Clostridia bacterium]|nr:glycosyl transferase [Clostridia bacterium]
MIPKTIHYCWFGGKPLPELAQKCIASWKKYCPDYEIIEWNESNFDFSECNYAREAYEAKKWAFITDYVRLKVLYENGGIYMDTDVEVLKPLDSLLQYEAVSGFESETQIPTGLIACREGLPIIGELLQEYDNIHFKKDDGTLDLMTNVIRITNTLLKYGLKQNNTLQTINGFTLLPKDYLCPKDLETGIITITDNTLTIHHFDGSWLPEEEKYIDSLYRKYSKKFPNKTAHRIAVAKVFTAKYGIIKMPIALVKRKINNLIEKNKQL